MGWLLDKTFSGSYSVFPKEGRVLDIISPKEVPEFTRIKIDISPVTISCSVKILFFKYSFKMDFLSIVVEGIPKQGKTTRVRFTTRPITDDEIIKQVLESA